MQQENWTKLEKCSCKNHYKIKPKANTNSKKCIFSRLAFDVSDEILILVDSTGYAYHVELSYEDFVYKKLGFVGVCAFIAFNPMNKNEILIGLETQNIKITRFNNLADFCLLSGHTTSPKHVTFYKNYCLTVSNKEAIIWNLRSYSKVHQLILSLQNLIVQKASFSNLGHIVILYKNDIMQIWMFRKFDKDIKINLKDFGLQNVKDFAFTINGRAMILGGLQSNVVVFNTHNWDVIKSINNNKNLHHINEIMIVPGPLDGGANKIIAVLLSDCTLKFLDFTTSLFIKDCPCDTLRAIRRIQVSCSGKYLAHITKQGDLVISLLENVITNKSNKEKSKSCKIYTHCIEDHLRYMQNAVKQELKLERLLSILKVFEEYPEKHRSLIWSTLLKLPSNRKAYIALSNKVCDTFNTEWIISYSLADKQKATLLKTTLSCLVQWCPLIKQSTFLPNFIFPFIVVFQKNPLLAFEGVLNIILNYCQKWFEYHPLPPLNILGIVENILLEADPTLLNIFCEHGITSTDYAWPLLRTSFSEVLSAKEWLILWDHLLSYGRPSLFLMCAVSYSVCCREIIISTLKSSQDFQQFYSNQGCIEAKNVLKVAHQLDQLLPQHIHPEQYIRNNIEALPSCETYPPLPEGEYPKILAEDLRVLDLKQLKEQGQIIQKHRRKAAQLVEEERVRTESQNFKQQIHKARMEELRKCYEEVIKDQEWDLNQTREDGIWDASEEHISFYKKCKQVAINEPNSGVTRINKLDSIKKTIDPKFCTVMQKEVEQLEYEVCNLISNIRSKDLKINRK